MTPSLPRVAPPPSAGIHASQAGAQGRPTAPDRAPERAPQTRPFADMLRQRRFESSPPAAAPTSPPAPVEPASSATATESGGDAEAEADPSTPEKDVASARARARSKLPGKGAARLAKDGSEARLSEARAREDGTPEAAVDRRAFAAEAATPRPMPVLDDKSGRGPTRTAEGGSDDAGRIEADSGEAGDPSAGDSAPRGRLARTAASDARSAGGQGPGRAEAPDSLHPAPAALVAEQASATNGNANASRPTFDLLLHPIPQAATISAPLASGESMRADAPVPTLALPTPVDSPQFAGALGVQVSLLAKGGVQHAELHLNPAEMGPVSIRIQLDGSEAQVQFGADLAATREAIESGLPELASALREAGFTLCGGGVSQHARQRGGGEGTASSMPRGVPPHADPQAGRAEAAGTVRHVAAGGIDVYA